MSELFLSTKITEENVKKAAKWWADCIRNGAKMDNGDKSFSGFLSSFLAEKMRPECTTEQSDAFEKNLADVIREKNPTMLSVDYAPDMLLQEAADKTGIEISDVTLPCKTVMWFTEGVVKVRSGYGAEIVVLP